MFEKEALEKEADNYAEKHAFRIPYDGSDKFYDDVDYKASKEGYLAGAEPREKRIAELEETNERIASKYYELQETLKKVRVALIQERVANIMNYGNGGVEMFDDLLKMTEQEE